MKKIVAMSLFVINLFAFPTEKSIHIIKSSEKMAYINENVSIGSTGVVVQDNIIIASVEAIGNKVLKYTTFGNLKNSSVASPLLMPKSGDKIKMYHNYDKIVIISPNQENYINIKSKMNIEVIDSDLLVAMAKDDIDGLEKENFQNFCVEYNVGLIYFNLDKDYIVDCKSFQVIESKENNLKTEYEKPLFTTYSITKDSMDYINYYKSLFSGE
jgi:hypothetical protein